MHKIDPIPSVGLGAYVQRYAKTGELYQRVIVTAGKSRGSFARRTR
jgi:hypothetical protein